MKKIASRGDKEGWSKHQENIKNNRHILIFSSDTAIFATVMVFNPMGDTVPTDAENPLNATQTHPFFAGF